MSRSTLSAANRAEISKNSLRVAEFASFAFPGGTIRVTTAGRDVVWGGYTWSSSALLSSYDGLSEHSDLKSRRISLKLSGLDDTLLQRIFTDTYQYANVQVWLGFFDEKWVLVDTPYPLTDVLPMSNAVLGIDGSSGEVELSAETWDVFGQRDSAVLGTPESQRLRYAGDTGQDKCAAIATLDIEWGGRFTRIGDDRGRIGGSEGGYATGGGIGGSAPVSGGGGSGDPMDPISSGPVLV